MIPLETLETMPPVGVSLLGFQDGGPESPPTPSTSGPLGAKRSGYPASATVIRRREAKPPS